MIVPSRRLASLERAYAKLRPGLPTDKGEVKGRLLDERQVASVVECLKEHSVVFEAAGIELGAHTEAGLLAYQERQADEMTTIVVDRHPGWVRQRFENFRREYEAFPLNLVVQSRLNFHLIRRVLEWDTMYFSQRRPEELGAYHWVIDAKGDTGTPTSWERWWSEFVMPVLHDQPIYMLPEGDYTHMRRFELELAPALKRFRPDADGPAMSILLLLEDFRFSNQPEPGMELVDIVTNATRRAVKDSLHLDRSGDRTAGTIWGRAGRIRPARSVDVDVPHRQPIAEEGASQVP